MGLEQPNLSKYELKWPCLCHINRNEVEKVSDSYYF